METLNNDLIIKTIEFPEPTVERTKYGICFEFSYSGYTTEFTITENMYDMMKLHFLNREKL